VEVIKDYDIMYTLAPLKQAICTKDDDDKAYCLPKMAPKSGSAKSVGSLVDQTVLSPNTGAIASSNLLFLFLQPTMSSADLCVPCTRNILTSYIAWESAINYAPGLASTQVLTGQSSLYEGVVKTCSSSFLSGSVAAAGGISNKFGGKNSAVTSANAQGALSSILGGLVLAFVSLL
jgi:hypothetical protein